MIQWLALKIAVLESGACRGLGKPAATA